MSVRTKHIVKNSSGRVIRTYYTYSGTGTNINPKLTPGMHVGGTVKIPKGHHPKPKPKPKPTPTPTPTPVPPKYNPRPVIKSGTPAPIIPGQSDGGPSYMSPVPDVNPNPNGGYNTENNLPLAQGYQTPWAQPTSISSMITGLLRESNNSETNAYQTMAKTYGLTGTLNQGSSSPWNYTLNLQSGQMQQLANSNNMGAFGTNMVMSGYYNGDYVSPQQQQDMQVAQGSYDGWVTPFGDGTVNGAPGAGMDANAYIAKYGGLRLDLNDKDKQDWMRMDPNGYKAAVDAANAAERNAINAFSKNFPNSTSVLKDSGGINAYNSAFKSAYANFFNKNAPKGTSKMNPDGSFKTSTNPPASTPVPGTPASPFNPPPKVGDLPPTYDTAHNPSVPSDINPNYGGVFNPWSTGQGGMTNSYGVSPQYLGQATMDSMALANAYFAPQRMELAYQLGDMETDMRRLAVNLGRQTDDPVLQAKLYKEAAQATRTLDVQQNTFAFQMAEQRRKEETQNFQYYDQLAQQEYQMRLANRQYYDRLNLDRNIYNLQWYQVANAPTASNPTAPAASPTAPASTPAAASPTAPATQQQDSFLSQLYNRSLQNNSLYGAGNLLK